MKVKEYKENYIKFLREAKDLGKNIKLEAFDEIFIAGMGGSGVAGMFLNSLIKNQRINIVNTDKLPFYAKKESLVIVVSYSGNTEEMISIFNESQKKGCQIVVITSGGNLRDKCIHDNLKYVRIPAGIQPRDALPYLLIPMMNVLTIEYDINKLVDGINNSRIKEKAKDLADNLKGKIPIIYSSDRIYPVVYRWKTQLNENAKIHAFSNKVSELNHNELEGYENLNGNYYVVMIRDENDPLIHVKRLDLMKKLIMGKKVPVLEIAIRGKDLFNRMIVESFIGDITSLYLAEDEEINSAPVTIIEEFKKNLKK